MTTPINNLTNLDFDGLKQSLIAFLQSQPQFRDYNFTGSNLSVLLDVLALNSFQNQFFLNMALSESFLDSAQLKDSILSHAKELNYLPRSSRSAVGYVNVEVFPNDAPSTVTIQKGAPFSARIDNAVYTFLTDQSYTLIPVSGRYYANTVPIYEGKYISEYFIVNDQIDGQRFVLSNKKVDTSSISVEVFETGASTTSENFLFSPTLLGLSSTSKVFFLQASQEDKYELLFGDGIAGEALEHLNVVLVTYRTCNESLSNKATNFTSLFPIDGYSNVVLETLTTAAGGAEAEGLESIRFYAPRHFKTQERAVTAEDYETLLKERFPEIEAISVFGGEEVDPPEFGRVLISVDLADADGIPEIKKTAIIDYIKTRAAITVQPRVIDPVFAYVSLVSEVKYNPSKTTLASNDLKSLVLGAISDFRDAELNDFNISVILSKISTEIDNADVSISGNKTTMKLVHYIVPTLNQALSVTIEFQNALKNDLLNTAQLSFYAPALTSSSFTFGGRNCILEDDGTGQLQIVTRSASDRTVISNIGTVNYVTGKVTVTNLEVSAYVGEAIKLYAALVDTEISVRNNKILDLSLDDVTVTVST